MNLAEKYRRIELGKIVTLRNICLLIIAISIVIRVITFFTMDIACDGARYSAMGESIADDKGFTMPYGTIYFSDSYEREPSHHYPPLYPIYLSVFYLALGFSPETTKLASILSGILLMVVVYLTTKNLYDKDKALFVTTLVAITPQLIISDGVGYSESFVTLFFVLTIWAILKSLTDSKWMILAGLFAGIGYLAKSSVGYFFIIAGTCGFLWRFYYMRWEVFKDKYYMAAIVVFGFLVGGWSLRNITTFGFPNWQTSNYIDFTTSYAMSNFSLYLYGLMVSIPIFILFFLSYSIFFLPELKRSVKKVKDEYVSGMWMAVVLPFILGWIISTMLWTWEQYPVFWHDRQRYVIMALVPLLWIVMNEVDDIKEISIIHSLKNISKKRLLSFNSRFALNCLCLVCISCIALLPYHYAEVKLANGLNDIIEDGDIIAVDGIDSYSLYPYLEKRKEVRVIDYEEGCGVKYIVTRSEKTYEGYHMLFSQKTNSIFGDESANVWINSSFNGVVR